VPSTRRSAQSTASAAARSAVRPPVRLTPPTDLAEVDVAGEPRRGVPLAVVVSKPADDDGGAPGTGPLLDRLGVDAAWLEAAGVTGGAGSVHAVPRPGSRPPVGWLVGVGAGSVCDYRAAGAALVRAAAGRAEADRDAGRPVSRALQVALPPDVTAEQAAGFALGATLGSYSFRITADDRSLPTRSVTLVGPDSLAEPVEQAVVLARATALTRDLANMPSDVKDPAWLADTAARLAGDVPGLAAQVRDERWLAEQGFGGVLAVGCGSARPPRLIELAWRPRGTAAGPHLVLVGKGITFDTGGISIKPADNLHLMRTDMAGGAAVIAAMLAIGRLRLPLRVTGLVPAAENHVSGSAYRPGDIVRHYDGRTTEVTNTDAEGRMVLADGIGYAVRTLRPDLIVDVATLTGAVRIALGTRTGGVFATTDELARQVIDAGERVGETWWRMPLGYDVVQRATGQADDVRSEVADVRQCPPGPGSIAAALFLREFTGGLPWAHLDIAGAARAEKSYDEVSPGATGIAARTLVELARTMAP
jgi:leucyl aminopeptidase